MRPGPRIAWLLVVLLALGLVSPVAAGATPGNVGARGVEKPSVRVVPDSVCSVIGGGIEAIVGGGGGIEAGCSTVVERPVEVAVEKVAGLPGAGAELVEHAVGGAVSSVAGTALNGISAWIAQGAIWVMRKVAGLVQSTTRPELRSGWFGASYAVMAAIAAPLALLLLLFALIRGLVRRDPGEVARAALVQLPLAGLLTGLAVALVGIGVRVTDGLCNELAASVGGSAHAFVVKATKALIALGVATQPAVPAFLVALIALVGALAAFAVWVELLLRESAIYIAVFFLPVTFAGLVWAPTARMARRMVEMLTAIITSKFFVVAVILLAFRVLTSIGSGGSFSAALAGVALMLMACFAPFVLLRLIPHAEAALAPHDHMRAAAGQAADRLGVDHVRDAMRRNFAEQRQTTGAAERAGAGTEPWHASGQAGPGLALAGSEVAGASSRGTGAAAGAATGAGDSAAMTGAAGVAGVAGGALIGAAQAPEAAGEHLAQRTATLPETSPDAPSDAESSGTPVDASASAASEARKSGSAPAAGGVEAASSAASRGTARPAAAPEDSGLEEGSPTPRAAAGELSEHTEQQGTGPQAAVDLPSAAGGADAPAAWSSGPARATPPSALTGASSTGTDHTQPGERQAAEGPLAAHGRAPTRPARPGERPLSGRPAPAGEVACEPPADGGLSELIDREG